VTRQKAASKFKQKKLEMPYKPMSIKDFQRQPAAA
jgi:hypothetical protein